MQFCILCNYAASSISRGSRAFPEIRLNYIHIRARERPCEKSRGVAADAVSRGSLSLVSHARENFSMLYFFFVVFRDRSFNSNLFISGIYRSVLSNKKMNLFFQTEDYEMPLE